ncbi:MAG TPA: Asp-tRNA(Asn)/Glu-tRNA(Gln) amidotransferase subunit GatC [Spirochaetia bacterium]|nr:Asp-tRNA(Asn)/Glu-tRNA(Gln) amidotransferase subunit GatC [Spirochaetia bacterium]
MDMKELEITASLANLELQVDEMVRFSEGVSRMLEFFSTMMEVNVEGNEPTTHALLSNNRSREDVILESGCDMLKSAPEREDRFIVIPNVL